MIRILVLGLCLTLLNAVPASAQTAVRCDQGGQTAYNEKSCPSGDAGKVVAPTQDSAAQRQAAKDANEQLRKDTQAIDQRLTHRVKSESASRSATGKPPRTVADKSKSAKGDKSGATKKKHKRKASAAKSSAAKSKSHDAVTREPKRAQP